MLLLYIHIKISLFHSMWDHQGSPDDTKLSTRQSVSLNPTQQSVFNYYVCLFVSFSIIGSNPHYRALLEHWYHPVTQIYGIEAPL